MLFLRKPRKQLLSKSTFKTSISKALVSHEEGKSDLQYMKKKMFKLQRTPKNAFPKQTK